MANTTLAPVELVVVACKLARVTTDRRLCHSWSSTATQKQSYGPNVGDSSHESGRAWAVSPVFSPRSSCFCWRAAYSLTTSLPALVRSWNDTKGVRNYSQTLRKCAETLLFTEFGCPLRWKWRVLIISLSLSAHFRNRAAMAVRACLRHTLEKDALTNDISFYV